MSRKNICQKICASLPGNFLINKGIIYHAAYQHVIRGFLVEGSAYKDNWRLHDFTFALFRTHKFIHISNCQAFSNGNASSGTWFEGDDKTIVSDALQAIHASHSLADILQGCSPAQYLERYSVPDLDDAHPTDAFDLACAAGLCGDLTFARTGLESARQSRIDLARLYGPYTDHDAFLQMVADWLAALDGGVEAFRAFQQKATAAAAAAHGFCPPSFGKPPAGA